MVFCIKVYFSRCKSASKSVYDNIKKNDKTLFKDLMGQASFYTMIGMIHIDNDKEDDLIEFLKGFEKTKQKKNIKIGIDNLFEDLSEESNFNISAEFIGLGINLDKIYYDINRYRDSQ